MPALLQARGMVRDLGIRGLGFRVRGLGFWVYIRGLYRGLYRDLGLGFGAWDLGFESLGLGF